MNRGEFLIGGKSSKDLKARIQNRPIIQVPTRKSNRFDVPWRNGTIFYDLDSYENTGLDLSISLKSKNFGEAEENRRNLVAAFDSPSYLRFIYYADDTKAYYVKTENILFEKVGINTFNQNVLISLTVRPYKLEKTPLPVTSTTKTITLTNPYQWTSEPIITLEGSGDTTLTVNGKEFTFKKITSGMKVDSSVRQCYKMVGGVPENHNDKMFTMNFPILKTGANTITWTGSITKVTVEPRWNTIV